MPKRNAQIAGSFRTDAAAEARPRGDPNKLTRDATGVHHDPVISCRMTG
jgi:hypothetical protein